MALGRFELPVRLLKMVVVCLVVNSLFIHADQISIIPKPVEMVKGKGIFKLKSSTKVVATDKKSKFLSGYLITELRKSCGFKLKKAKSGSVNSIKLRIDAKLPDIKAEGYILLVNSNGVKITGKDEAGLFYGIQTLKQLLPPEAYASAPVKARWGIPAVKIIDYPRFKWRGMHLDPCRHFVSKEWTLKFIDMLAMHKMNKLHWHLTEDQAWRIEIKKFPKLTEVGAWRKGTGFGLKEHTTKYYNDKGQYGGFYTQKDIREIVKYASMRHVTIVPEIELPGHAMAALTAYPEFSCTGGPFEIPLRAGVMKDVYCPGKEKTFLTK